MITVARPDLDAGSLLEQLQRKPDAASVARYERALRDLLGLPAVHAVDSGRAAMVAALRASAVKGRGEVIVPSFVCPAVIDAVRAAGGTAVLADSDPGTPNLSAAHVAELIGERTHAVIAPHVFGIPANVHALDELARRAGAVLIEDCAHAIGATVDGVRVGRTGTFAVFSTNFDKPFTTGFGGALAVNDPRHAAAVEAALRGTVDAAAEDEHLFGLLLDVILSRRDLYRRGVPAGQGRLWLKVPHIRALYRRWREGRVAEPELRSAVSRLIDLHPRRKSLVQRVLSRAGIGDAKIEVRRMGAGRAALGLSTIAAYAEAQTGRQQNAARYAALLTTGNTEPIAIPAGTEPRWLRYAVIARDAATAQEISARAAEAGYRVGNMNWPHAIHQLPRYRRAARFDRAPHAESLAARIVNLPLHGEIGEADVRTLAGIIAGANGAASRGAA
jgi:dTDP-4-amino-4,6-dideoxygalactose transaminase